MIDHMSTYAINYEVTKSFYTQALKPLGAELVFEMALDDDEDLPGRRICAFGPGRAIFWVIETIVEYTPRHTAFSATNESEVNAFYEAALGAGGTDHGAPGLRPIYHPKYYGAFVLDPDGNNVEAVYHGENWGTKPET